jgi:predicted transposase/invertase (TIGR01784 family)
LRDDDIFIKLFKIAEISNLTPAEMNAYQQSLKIKRDNYNHDQYVLEQGLQQGLQQGEAKGEYNKSLEIASELKKEGLTVEFIAKTTKLSIEEIQSL